MRGLAGRLTLSLVASLAAALLVLGGSLVLSLSHHLVAQAAHEAQQVARQTAKLASAGVNGQELSLNDPGMLGAAVGRSNLYLQVSEGARVIQQSPNLRTTALPVRPPRRQLLTWGKLPLWGTGVPLTHIRGMPAVYAESAVTHRGKTVGSVQAAVSLALVVKAVHTVGQGLIRVGITVMTIASVLSALFVYRSFRRIRRLSQAARNIESAQDLKRRIPTTGPQDEVRELAQSFNHMMNRLEHSFQGQRLITAQASHQLRTPLAAAIGYTSMLRKWGKADPALVSEGIEVIHEQLQRLERIIDVVLRLAELDAPDAQHMQHTELSRFFHEWRSTTATSIRLLGGPKVELGLDEDMLSEVLNILVDNAVRHAGPEVTITMTWRIIPKWAKIRIEDNGPGFPPDLIPHLFKPFAKNSRSPGTGLGLALAHALIERQGGRIGAENVWPHGARVLIQLPRSD